MPTWTAADTRARVRVALRESFPVMFGAEWERARDIFYAAFAAQHLDHVRPMPGAADALAAGAPWPQGVVSNKAGRYLRAEVAHLGWAAHFGVVIGAGDAAADKPDPAPILLALDRLGRPPTARSGISATPRSTCSTARAAGVTAVLVGDAAHDGGIDRAHPDIHFPLGLRPRGTASRACVTRGVLIEWLNPAAVPRPPGPEQQQPQRQEEGSCRGQ